MRGFKRVDPTSQSTNQKQQPLKTPPVRNQPEAKEPSRNQAPPASNSQNESGQETRKKYCHYLSNYGRCNFEERSGDKCKFSHDQAPMCNSGINCSRFKCMFSHPRQQGSNNNNFLGQARNMNQWMNPWEMMAPWMNQMNQNQNQFQNPWNNGQSREKQ